jgi:hypothetical protein
MSQPALRDFGSVVGVNGKDVRIVIGGSGRKNLLSVVATYNRATAAAHDPTTFYGRLTVIQGEIPVAPDIDAFTLLQGKTPKILFDAVMHDVGPHVFFFPLAQLQGNVQTEEDATMTIILAAGQDAPNGKVFTGRLNCAGQTVFGGAQSGIRGTP